MGKMLVEPSNNANSNICSGGMNVPHPTNSNEAVFDKESNKLGLSWAKLSPAGAKRLIFTLIGYYLAKNGSKSCYRSNSTE